MRRFPSFVHTTVLASTLLVATPARAADLYRDSTYESLTADRRASRPGDIVTILIYENSSASNTADTSTKTGFGVQGSVSTLYAGKNSAQVGLGDNYGGKGQIQRTGRLLAQLSANVTGVTPSGDLIVAGTQDIDVNGEKTRIRLEGRIRPIDIAANNTVLSTRLADAKIDYTGEGFITDRSRPGLIPRFFAWLGLW
ncbi:flagellar basal body L-ring protein FlgH [Burkholderia cenocepacia]|uniref:flagellar basal body L-ring protein FlgH n=1 Tax=Burkholderia cenocepacia TaxID=95486 RepID=UPI000F595FBE|nr:flagellar basal body L-ring protein FlgH [Burkholderia cenocepacia]MCW3640051.1 flagellar basal body L-ring protein FlgH [Burkholderia cenocepacia]RQU51485.1 flagellar basal body L-ring protein FlgH [Burkholderia cenocepacia]RQV33680.1 flagellar basal body L-ring protein FlgH [Burkholderia cenocepacia]